MADELWRQYYQIGLESTPGTGVAATRRMYFTTDSSRLSRERAARPHRFATASRDNVRAFTLGATVVGGTLAMPLSASEILEFLLMTVKGNVTPTGAGTAKLWTFTPSATLDPATVEWHDGALAWEANGCYGNSLTFAGNANGENMVTMDVFGMKLSQTTMTAALTERVPDFIEGWETRLYTDAFGGTPGSTQVTGTLINWNVQIQNNLGRAYYADNTQDAGAIPIGELSVNASLLFKAGAAAAAAEFSNWDGATKRIVRLDFGNNVVIDGSDKYFLTIDIPGAWEAFDLGGSNEGMRAYELGLQYVYDPTNTFGLQIRAQNARTAAW